MSHRHAVLEGCPRLGSNPATGINAAGIHVVCAASGLIAQVVNIAAATTDTQ